VRNSGCRLSGFQAAHVRQRLSTRQDNLPSLPVRRWGPATNREYMSVGSLIVEVGRGIARAGLRKLVIFNSHGGQASLVDLAAVQLRAAEIRNHLFVFVSADIVNSSFSSQSIFYVVLLNVSEIVLVELKVQFEFLYQSWF